MPYSSYHNGREASQFAPPPILSDKERKEQKALRKQMEALESDSIFLIPRSNDKSWFAPVEEPPKATKAAPVATITARTAKKVETEEFFKANKVDDWDQWEDADDDWNAV